MHPGGPEPTSAPQPKVGRNPQTPNFPENAVDEVCTNMDDDQSGYTSIRITNDYPPGENAPAEGEETSSGSEGTDANFIKEKEEENAEASPALEIPLIPGNIPVGIYIGSANWTAGGWDEITQPNNSKVTISISEDGTVTGTISQYIKQSFANETENCSGYYEFSMSGSFNGQINGPIGLIESTENWDYIDTSDRPVNKDNSYTLNQQIDVEVSGNMMSGTSRSLPEDTDGLWVYTLTATKQ